MEEGTVGLNFADSIVPQGPVDGTNTVFYLPDAPSPGFSLRLDGGGVTQSQVPQGTLEPDYTLSGNKITFAVAPATGTMLVAWYRF